MVKTGIAGTRSVTCFVAALDCLLTDRDLPYRSYAQYSDAYMQQYYFGANRKQTRAVIRNLLHDSIQSHSLKNIVCRRVTNSHQCTQVLDQAKKNKWLIILVVEKGHVVGLQPKADNSWIMVGNGLPCHSSLTTEEVFPYLYIPRRSQPDINNIYLISPP